MAPASTTYDAIRDSYITLLERATPYELPTHAYRRAPRRYDLLEWAASVGSASLRAFEMVRGEDDIEEPEHEGTGTLERDEVMTITVAYPVLPALYGADELDDLECVMRSDVRRIREVVQSGSNFLAGQSRGHVTPNEPDRTDDRVWFQSFRVELTYSESNLNLTY
jgi:hypothetical protein